MQLDKADVRVVICGENEVSSALKKVERWNEREKEVRERLHE